jgi:broad specificity phosphatase PhoE
MKRVIVIRHTQSVHHVNGMVGGTTDWPLTEYGRRQAAAIAASLAQELAGSGPWVLLTSNQRRAQQTACIVGQVLGMAPQLRPALREIDLGSATGQTSAWFAAHKQPFDPAREAWMDYRYLPDAESHREVYARVATVVEEMEQSAAEQFLVVSHGGTLDMLIARWLRLPPEACDRMSFRSQSGGVTRLGEDDMGRRLLLSLNDCSSCLGLD